jgi:transcriptional regulator with GAF, ATPase, and Fis domain
VADELARCLDVHHATLFRLEPDGTGLLLAGHHETDGTKMLVGQRLPLDGESVAARVFRTGRPARMDSHEHDNAPGPAAEYIRRLGMRSGVGVPIMVDGRVWGAAIVGSAQPDPLPPDTESRVGDFADLVTTAIANAEAHAQLTASRARLPCAPKPQRLGRDQEHPYPKRASLSAVVVQQGTRVPAEWLLVLGGLLRSCPGSGDDLGISRALLHRSVGRSDRCQSNDCRGCGDGEWRDI